MCDRADTVREKYWKIRELAQSDVQYRYLTIQLRALDKAYEQVLQGLPEEQRDIVCNFVSMCEQMSERMLEVACEKMDFAE